jgi:hypothetical protein
MPNGMTFIGRYFQAHNDNCMRKQFTRLITCTSALILSVSLYAEKPKPDVAIDDIKPVSHPGALSVEALQTQEKDVELTPLHPDRGIALIWYGNQDNLNSRGGVVTAGQTWYMWKWFEPTEGNYNFSDLDSQLQKVHSKGLKTTIQINGNQHPDYLYKIVPYLKGVTYPTSQDDPLMYWHPVYKEKYRNMINALAEHLKASPYKDAVLGIRHNYNSIGTEHHYIRPEHRTPDLWTVEEGVSASEQWPWTEQLARQYMTWTIDMYLEAFDIPSGIFVFLRAESVSGGAATPYHLSLLESGSAGIFHTSSEPQPRSGKNNQFRVFVDYAKTGKTYALMESWSASVTDSDGWGWTKTKRPITKAQFNYWTLLCDLHCGATFPAMRPADVDMPETREDYEFAKKYAGYIGRPDVSPGTWIAFREGDFLVGDYTFLMNRAAGDNSQALYNVDNEKQGLWARGVQPGNSMKILMDAGFTFSLNELDTVEVRIWYKDEGTGYLDVKAFGQSFRTLKKGTNKWQLLRRAVVIGSLENEIQIIAGESSVILHRVEVCRDVGPDYDPPHEPVTGVSLEKDSITIPAGSTLLLSANIIPASATNVSVSWASSNSDIADVDQNGLIRAREAGTATITVTTMEGGFSASVIVKVIYQYHEDFMDGIAQEWTLSQYFMVSTGKLSTTHTAANCTGIYEGQAFHPPYIYRLSFLSSGTAAASVVRIIFNYRDQNNYYYLEFRGGSGGTATLKKLVNGVSSVITEYGVFNTSNTLTGLEIEYSGNHITVIATKGSEQFVLFDKIPDNSLNSGKIGLSTSYSNVHFYNVQVLFESTGPTFIRQEIKPLQFNIYPNPVSGPEFTIEFPVSMDKKSIEIYNILGELIYSKNLGEESVVRINFDRFFGPGLYLIKIRHNNAVSTKKLIIT